MVTDRQKEILAGIVEEYISSAQPVSSQTIERKYGLRICPATIRIEMQKLTDRGLLSQPHTSSGRVPSDKGYRYFVDDLLGRGFSTEDSVMEMVDSISKDFGNTFKLIHSFTKALAYFSSNLTLCYLFNKKIFWKEGWEEIIQTPEFKEKKFTSNFIKLLQNFEEEIENLDVGSEIKLYIGKENPFSSAKDFSIIVVRCRFPKKDEGILAILGPKRMTYSKNIGLLNSFTKRLESF